MEVTGALSVPFAVLLVWAGLDKLRSPDGARQALRLVGAPGHPVLVRGLPLAEVALGASFLSFGGRALTGSMLLMYVGFAFVVAWSLWTGATRSCGCFGADSSEVSWLHLVVDLCAVAILAAGFATGIPSPLGATLDAGWAAPAVVIGAAVSGFLARALLIELPGVLASARRTEVQP